MVLYHSGPGSRLKIGSGWGEIVADMERLSIAVLLLRVGMRMSSKGVETSEPLRKNHQDPKSTGLFFMVSGHMLLTLGVQATLFLVTRFAYIYICICVYVYIYVCI